MKEILWINGKRVKRKDAKVSIFDHSFLYGDGIFETMRAYKGKVFGLRQHIERLFNASKILKIKIPYSKTYLKGIISKLTKGLKTNSAYIRIAVTRGEGKIGLSPKLCKRPNVIIWLNSFKGFSESFYRKGAKVIISSVRRNNYSPVSNIKSNNYLNNILALTEAEKEKKDDSIMLNTGGFVSEATTSNVFIVKGKKLITPRASEGLLPGVTRDAIMKLAPAAGFKVLERRINVNELKKADEVFITNSIIEVRGVTEVNNKKISGGKVGSVTKLFHHLYKGLIFLLLITVAQCLYAAPIEGPNMPNNKYWKTGVQANVMKNVDMERPKAELESRNYFLTLSYGITERISFDGKIGIGDVTFDIENSQKIEYETNFAGGYGGRILLYNDKESGINSILGLHHISIHPGATKIGGVKHEAILDEWQGSVLFSKKISQFRPYIAGKFSEIDLIRKVNDVRKRIKPESSWGLVLGTDFNINDNARFNIEMRFFDEESLTFAFNYTF